MSDAKKLADLENELRELIGEDSRRLSEANISMSEADIRIELEDCRGLRTKPPQVLPELWDPDGKLRRVDAEIIALRKRIDTGKS